ncbi:MAG TPA: sialidase family protein, partial [Terriglobales bacterium]
MEELRVMRYRLSQKTNQSFLLGLTLVKRFIAAMNRAFLLTTLLLVSLALVRAESKSVAPVRKVTDVLIYQDDKFYSAFPSIVQRNDDELLVAFRRAPNRKLLGEKSNSHTDPNSQLVLVRSRDNGQTWS